MALHGERRDKPTDSRGQVFSSYNSLAKRSDVEECVIWLIDVLPSSTTYALLHLEPQTIAVPRNIYWLLVSYSTEKLLRLSGVGWVCVQPYIRLSLGIAVAPLYREVTCLCSDTLHCIEMQ